MIILRIGQYSCIYPSDLCYMKTKSSCKGEHRYECDSETCAKKKAFCQSYSSMTYLFDCSLCKIARSQAYGQQMVKLIQFFQSIKECPFYEEKLSLNDVCINEETCYEGSTVEETMPDSSSKRAVPCNCTNEYNYKCGEHYCAKDHMRCKRFYLRQKINTTKALAIGIKKCRTNI